MDFLGIFENGIIILLSINNNKISLLSQKSPINLYKNILNTNYIEFFIILNLNNFLLLFCCLRIFIPQFYYRRLGRIFAPN